MAHRFVEEFQQGDIYNLLNSGTRRYGFVCLTIGDLSIDGDLATMNGTLFWADRLTDDQANALEVRSNGVSVLKDIMLRIENSFTGFRFTSQSYSVFTEQFSDLCAGAFVQFSMTYPMDSVCAGDSFVIKTINITENGLYDIIGYSKAVVNVVTPTQVKSLSVTENGTYEVAPDTGFDLSKVNVSVSCDVVEPKTLVEVTSAWITAMVQRVINS